jgi:hypothetical protein
VTALLDVSADVELAHATALLEEAAATLAAIDIAALTGIGTGEQLLALRRSQRRVDAVASAAMVKFARSSEWEIDGARHAVAWLEGRSNDAPGAGRRLLKRGSLLESFPCVLAAWRHGDVSTQHVDALGNVHRRYPRLRDALVAVDAEIAIVATSCTPMEFFQRLRELCHRHDPQAVADDEIDERDRASLHVSTHLDGWVKIDGNLDPVLGARFVAVLEAARRRPECDSRAGHGMESGVETEPGAVTDQRDAWDIADRPLPGDAERRPLSQRNVEALERILDAAGAAIGDDALPRVTGERPTVNVTVPIEALMHDGSPEAAWLERFGVPTTLISGAAARHLACDASLRPMLVDRRGQLVAMLPKVRLLHHALRRAVFIRDVHCRFPRCRQRIDQVHHLIFHSHGGPTVLSNLIGLCGYHHRRIHDGKWSAEGDPGGQVVFRSRMGEVSTSDPPGLL